jgi:hypothetical protein
MEAWIDDGAHLLRSLFGQAQRYRHAGVTRDDMAANNARALAAIEKLGLPRWTSLRVIAAPSLHRRSFAVVLWQWMTLTRWQRTRESPSATVDEPEDEA